MAATVLVLRPKPFRGYQPPVFSGVENAVVAAFENRDHAQIDTATRAWVDEVAKGKRLHPVRHRILCGWARNVIVRNLERRTSPISVISELRDILGSPQWTF